MSYCQFPSRHPALLPPATVIYRFQCYECQAFRVKAVCEECYKVKVEPLIKGNAVHRCLTCRASINTSDCYALLGAA